MPIQTEIIVIEPKPYNQISSGYWEITSGGGYQNRGVVNSGDTMIVLDDPSDTAINGVKQDLLYVPIKKVTITIS